MRSQTGGAQQDRGEDHRIHDPASPAERDALAHQHAGAPTRWRTNTLARELGTNQSMVSRVWRANGLKPHLIKTFKVGNNLKFATLSRNLL